MAEEQDDAGVASRFVSLHELGEQVLIDGVPANAGVVTGFQFRLERSPMVEVSMVRAAQSVALWVEEWRLVKRPQE